MGDNGIVMQNGMRQTVEYIALQTEWMKANSAYLSCQSQDSLDAWHMCLCDNWTHEFGHTHEICHFCYMKSVTL